MRNRLRTVYVTGAAGSGTTTLGRALAVAIDALHIDTDDHYWVASDPPFQTKRPVTRRIQRIRRLQSGSERWVISGALEAWGADLVDGVDLVVFVLTSTDTRLDRIRKREAARFGAAVSPGGSRHMAQQAFLEWAGQYETGLLPGRSRAGQEAWLASITSPVLRLNGGRPVAELVVDVLEGFERLQAHD